jgi:hypothetical protein
MWRLQSLPLAPFSSFSQIHLFGGDGDDEVRRFPPSEPVLVRQAIASSRVEGLQQREGHSTAWKGVRVGTEVRCPFLVHCHPRVLP